MTTFSQRSSYLVLATTGAMALLAACISAGAAEVGERAPGPAYTLTIENGFEEGADGFAGWSANPDGMNDAVSFAQDRDIKHSGTASLRISTEDGEEQYAWPALERAITGVSRDLIWTFSYRIKTDGDTSEGYAAVDYLDGNGERITFDAAEAKGGTEDWQEVTFSGRVADSTKTMNLRLIAHNPGVVWFDDVRFNMKYEKALAAVRHPVNHRKPGDVFAPEAEPAPAEFIKVADDNWTFIGSKSGRTFVPWGTTLAFPYSASTPDYKDSGIWNDQAYDINELEKAFKAMKALNVNLVKIALTISEFFKDVTGSHDYALDPLSMQRFDELLALARKYDIRLMVQPPNHWGGGGWGKGQWAEGQIGSRVDSLDVYVKFWEEFAAKYKDEPLIFGWSLCVEKQVYHPAEYLRHIDGWIREGNVDMLQDKPLEIKRFIVADFIAYLKETYASLDELNQAWKTEHTSWEQVRPAPNGVDAESVHNYDTQLYRQWVGERWVRRQVEAIRRVDPNHLVGCGIVQRNNPLVRQKHYAEVADSPATYGALEVPKIAKYLDFLDPHFYPVTFREPEKEMEWLKAYLRYCYVGKPLILGEFGHGNKEIMAEWNRLNVESSIGLVSGWMPWALHNTKGMGDHVTRVSGLVEDDFKTETEWGTVFKSLKRELMLDSREGIARNPEDTISFELDMKKMLCGSCERKHGNGVAYFSELEEIVRLGGAKIKFELEY